MVDTWKDWTGALYIYMNLPEEFGLSRIRFFLREAPNSLSLFTYIVLVECCNVIDSEREVTSVKWHQMHVFPVAYKERDRGK